jgi:hypothetical protein
MHRRRLAFGASGKRFAPTVARLMGEWGCSTILDYGCGKGDLARELLAKGIRVAKYDPAIPGLSRPPQPADLVVCTDVLEHVEPECLDDVLDDLRRLAVVGVYLAVGIGPADKTMPDGTNAHRIVQPMEWWLPKLDCYWKRVHAELLPRYEAPRKPPVDFEYVGRSYIGNGRSLQADEG